MRVLGQIGWIEVAYLVAIVLSLAATGMPELSPDSGGYLRAGETYPYANSETGVSTSWGGVSLTGDAFRSWPVPLFYSLVPAGDAPLGNMGRVILQAALVVVLTIWLARALASFVPERGRPWIRGLVYLVALTPPAIAHMVQIGAEAPTYVFVVGATALMLTLVSRMERLSGPVGGALGAVLILLGLLASLARPSFVLLMLITTTFGTILIGRALPAAQRLPNPRSVPVLAGSSAVLFVLLGMYVSTVQDAQSMQWEPASERTYRYFAYLDEGKNPQFNDAFREALPESAPRCVHVYPEDTALTWAEQGAYATSACGEAGMQWIDDHFFTSIATFYLTHPRTAFAYAWEATQVASRRYERPSTRAIVPESLSNALYSNRSSYAVNAFGLFLILGAVGVVLLVRRTWATPDRWLGVLLASLVASAWAAFLLAALFGAVSAADRQQWPAYFLVIVLGVTALVVGISRRGAQTSR